MKCLCYGLDEAFRRSLLTLQDWTGQGCHGLSVYWWHLRMTHHNSTGINNVNESLRMSIVCITIINKPLKTRLTKSFLIIFYTILSRSAFSPPPYRLLFILTYRPNITTTSYAHTDNPHLLESQCRLRTRQGRKEISPRCGVVARVEYS